MLTWYEFSGVPPGVAGIPEDAVPQNIRDDKVSRTATFLFSNPGDIKKWVADWLKRSSKYGRPGFRLIFKVNGGLAYAFEFQM
jgi:hypothetical protein